MARLRLSLTVILSALFVAGAMAVVAPPPAEAQTARNLKCSGCVKSRQIRNGAVKNKDLSSSVSQGLVKAWARLNANGTVISCFRCNPEPSETRRLGVGIWEVDFTPLGTDISTRPRMCTSEHFTPGAAGPNTDDNICNTSTSTDLSTVNVRIWDGGVTPNTPEDDQFTVIIF